MFRYIKASELGLQTPTQHTQHTIPRKDWSFCIWHADNDATVAYLISDFNACLIWRQQHKKEEERNEHKSLWQNIHWIWNTANKSLYGNCLCKQRLDSGQDKIYKRSWDHLPNKTTSPPSQIHLSMRQSQLFHNYSDSDVPWKHAGGVHRYKLPSSQLSKILCILLWNLHVVLGPSKNQKLTEYLELAEK